MAAEMGINLLAEPQPGDDETCLQALPLAYALLQQQMRDGRATVVHCSSGKDRTGLLLAYYLVREAGLSVAEAMEELRRVRPCALTAVGWYQFAIDVLRQSLSHRRRTGDLELLLGTDRVTLPR